MARLKSGKFLESEKTALLAVPFTKGKNGPHKKKLEALAKKLNRAYNLVWQKWYALHKKAEKNAKKTPSQISLVVAATNRAIDKGVLNDVAAMKFEEIEFTTAGKWVSPEEEQAMKNALDKAMKDTFDKKKSLVFPTRLMDRAKTYLKSAYPKHAFTFYTHPDKKNTTHRVLVRKY